MDKHRKIVFILLRGLLRTFIVTALCMLVFLAATWIQGGPDFFDPASVNKAISHGLGVVIIWGLRELWLIRKVMRPGEARSGSTK